MQDRSSSYLVPVVVEQTSRGERAYDIYSRLLRDRIVFFDAGVDDVMASRIVAQLIYLDSLDPKEPINLYINSPGGHVHSGLGIIDTMYYVAAPVHTYCFGMAASMGAILLTCGEPGHRYCLPRSEVMIHQPMGGASGQASDIEIQAQHICRLKKEMACLLSETTGQEHEQIRQDMERDFWMTAEEAKEYGIVDQVIRKNTVLQGDD